MRFPARFGRRVEKHQYLIWEKSSTMRSSSAHRWQLDYAQFVGAPLAAALATRIINDFLFTMQAA